MLILTIRTDKPEAELGLFEDAKRLGYTKWPAHRELSDTIHIKMKELLRASEKDWHDLEGIVYFKGPGSFTGLRIGASVANALAAGLKIGIAGTSGNSWLENGLQNLADGSSQKMVLPEYGSPPHITSPRK